VLPNGPRRARDPFVADFNDITDAPSLPFDEPEPIGGNRTPNAAAVLGAVVGNCLRQPRALPPKGACDV